MNLELKKLNRTLLILILLTVLFIVAFTFFVFCKYTEKKDVSEHVSLSILFIGNSHTYYNDLPLTVQRLAKEDGYDCRITMIAHGGWYLRQHVKEPEVKFNILHGNYDYVVLQEYAQPFVQEEEYRTSANTLNKWIHRAGSKPVIYETWAVKSRPEDQAHMNEVHRRIAGEIDALLAPVGENWWTYQENHPEIEMFDADGEHASEAGSAFAAECIWETIKGAGIINDQV